MDRYTFQYLQEPIVREDGKRKRVFDWAIRRANATELEPEDSIVFLFQSYEEGSEAYDTIIGR